MNAIDRSLRALFSEVLATPDPYGLDALPCDVAPDDVGEGQGTRCTVLCPEGHAVPEGFFCPHTCAPGRCTGCPGNIEEPSSE